MIVTFLLGIGTGFFLTPEYAVMQKARNSGMVELGAADAYIDLRYIDNMIAHHMSAIYMLEQAQQQSSRKEIKELASTVIALDTKGIEELYAYKKAWYGNTRQIIRFNKVNLGKSDATFDLRLINALIAHHIEAINSAREIQTKSTRSEILSLADGVITLLSGNMQLLKEWRQAWYGIK